MNGFPEQTAGREEARRALAETRLSKARTKKTLKAADEHIARASEALERNHFTDAFKKMLRGAT